MSTRSSRSRDSLRRTKLYGSETPWRSLQDWRNAGGRTDRTMEISIGARRLDAQEIPLSMQAPLAAIVLRSRDDAAAPFRRIQNGLVVIALVGFAIGIAGAYWIARGATDAIGTSPSRQVR